MSKFAILKLIKPGPWTEDGEITVHVDHIVAIEEQEGCGAQHTKLTLAGGREVCVRGNHKDIRRALVKQAASAKPREPSLFEQIFGPPFGDARRRGWL